MGLWRQLDACDEYMMPLFTAYKKLRDNYWYAYGGWRGVFTSPYFIVSFIITIACYPIWLFDPKIEYFYSLPVWLYNSKVNFDWYDLPISILPNILGFSLGGYAILLAFGDQKFIALLVDTVTNKNDPTAKEKVVSGKVKAKTAFTQINATFMHFILMQSISLCFSVVSMVWRLTFLPFSFIGFLVFIYSLSLIIAAGFSVFNIAVIFNDYRNWERFLKEENEKQPEKKV